MNRRKKIKDVYEKRMKQANLKVNPKKGKPKYISKAERAKMEAEVAVDSSNDTTSEAAISEATASEVPESSETKNA